MRGEHEASDINNIIQQMNDLESRILVSFRQDETHPSLS